jgi:uncharacterized protein (TIGR00255 family)
MLKSMTAYGRATSQGHAGHLSLEIQSVNRKFLEINVFLPKELRQFDIEIRKWLLPYLTRGQISIKVTASFENISPFIIKPNLSLALHVKQAWDQIIDTLNLPKSDFQLSLLNQVDGLICLEENSNQEDTYRHLLKKLLEEAVGNFTQMKLKEGAALQKDIEYRINKISQLIPLIEKQAPLATEKYRDKLIARLDELVPGYVENEERILSEIVLFAEKIDIIEEITRFNFHLEHFKELIEQTALPSIGKTLEFVLQELGREINTIGNKSKNLEIGRYVIEIKDELERIREQIQNIE